MVDTTSKTGFISQIIGPVVDVEYPNGELPKIYNALVISSDSSSILVQDQSTRSHRVMPKAGRNGPREL